MLFIFRKLRRSELQKRTGKYLLVSVICFPLISVTAQEVPLFDSDDPIEIRIVGPLHFLKAQRDDDPDWLTDTQVFVKDNDGTERALDVEIKARGNFRRQEKICPFPPYWLNFKKKQVERTVFEGQDRIKVVSHCRENQESFDAYIYREYLAYKTYNLLTDNSFRVRLARIDYEDTQSDYKKESQVAFLIEHTDSLEKRLGVKHIKDRFILPSLYDLEELCLAELFQYFVSNTDFTFFASQDECCHNGKAFSFEDGSRDHLPVPYDFDMSGIVNAPYANPSSGMMEKGVKDVTQRYYLGVEVTDEILEKTIALYQSKKASIYDLWESFEPLDDKARAEALDFIDEFYEIIEVPQNVEKRIKETMESLDDGKCCQEG